MSLRLHAVSLLVPDYDEGIAFYVNKVGFALIQDTALTPRKRWVLIAATPDAGHHILLAKADSPDQQATIGNQTGGCVGFFLHSDEFDADYARMQDAGITFEETPRHEPYGKVAIWRDPWGNRWDLLQLS